MRGILDKIIALIPSRERLNDSLSPDAFTRHRALSLPKLIIFMLSLVASGKSQGVDGKSGAFFKQARRSGLWPDAEAVHRSTVTKARHKLPWQVFETLHRESVQLAYAVWPESPEATWHGLSVIAFDGSKYTVPASAELRDAFDPDSGLDTPGKGHYPQCLVSTAYDVFRRLPVARTVVGIHAGNEREEVKAMLPQIPAGSVWLFDRGYPSFDLIDFLNHHQDGYYLFRCPAHSTFPAVEQFVHSQQIEATLWIDPTHSVLKQKSKGERQPLQAIALRAIRLESPDGTVSVLLTNLWDISAFPAQAIIDLYFRRWTVETHYRDEKTSLGIETFHSQSENGVRQELFAILVMSVITRLLMVLSSPHQNATPIESQFKHAMMTLAADAACLVCERPDRALTTFHEVLTEIARVRYYKPKKPRPAYPRISKQPISKWQHDRAKKIKPA